jgi:hypothetical protein
MSTVEQYGVDECGEYKNDKTGCVQSAMDYLKVKGLWVEKTWLEEHLTDEVCASSIKSQRPAQAGRFIAGVAMRSGATSPLL